jgi:hypothetical protein
MAEEEIDSRIETGSEFSEQVMSEIGSLREELATIRRLLERKHKLDKVIEGYRYLPSDVENPIRWGFIGAWGKGGSKLEVDVHTTTEDKFFDHPYTSDENVAAFARAFADPNAVKICKYFFRKNSSPSREEIKEGCNLSDEELDAAVKPLLELQLAEWKDGRLRRTSHNYIVTLIAMTRSAFSSEHRKGYK